MDWPAGELTAALVWPQAEMIRRVLAAPHSNRAKAARHGDRHRHHEKIERHGLQASGKRTVSVGSPDSPGGR